MKGAVYVAAAAAPARRMHPIHEVWWSFLGAFCAAVVLLSYLSTASGLRPSASASRVARPAAPAALGGAKMGSARVYL